MGRYRALSSSSEQVGLLAKTALNNNVNRKNIIDNRVPLEINYNF